MNFFRSRYFKIFLHIFLGLLLGGMVALLYLSSSNTFKEYVQHQIQEQFKRDYGYAMSCNLDSIDILSCSMNLSGVHITDESCFQADDTQQSWSVLVETVKIKGLWSSLILRGYLKLSLSFDHVIMLENFEKIPQALPEFCAKMFCNSVSGFIVYDVISIADGLVYLKRWADGLNMQIPYACHMRAERDVTRIQLYVHDGSVGYQDTSIIENISGSLVCDLPYVDVASNITSQVQLQYDLVRSQHQIPGFFAGKIDHGTGEFVCKTQDGSISIDPIKINCTDTACWCNVMVDITSQLLHYFDLPTQLLDVAGFMNLELSADLYNLMQTVQASIVFRDVTYKSKLLFPSAKVIITQHSKDGFSGVFAMHDQNMFELSVHADQEKKSLTGNNLVDLEIPFHPSYKILKQGCQFALDYDQAGNVTGRYKIELYDQLLDQKYLVVGQLELIDGVLRIWGTINDLQYEGSLRLFPEYFFQSFCVKRGDTLLVDITTDPQDPCYVVGSVDFSVIHALISKPFKMSFAQEGSFIFKGSFKDGICGATVQTHYAHIRVPYIYNVIQNISATAELDIHEKKLTVKDVDVQWYEGTLSCARAQLYFDNNFSCRFVHAPLILHDVMLSWNKGLYGLVSGRILLQQFSEHDRLNVLGQLMVQKAEIKENIFSIEFQDMLLGLKNNNVKDDLILQPYIDVSLFTKDPLQVKTSFLTAKAVVDVRLQGILPNTELSGSIRLLSGLLLFPYKPLEIVQGRLLFMPEQPFDPVIELEAKGKLKRFHIGLTAWGSALDPHIQFDAQPYLTEDQIVSLLLLGVEDQSVSMVIPAFLTQRLKDIIFGPALSNIKLKSVFDRLLQSLKYVRFIPQFTNQTGRGGVRGIFEIDASENLQGKIDTNFAQLEDTKFDVDYAVTDDVTLRLQKDGPSAYGGQVEFCWKFS